MFKFGQNWSDYAHNALDEHKLDQAKNALATLLQRDNLRGSTFMDIGCGSGLHTVAAVLLQADSVFALDVDPECISVTRDTVKRFLQDDSKIYLQQASILEPRIEQRLPTVDVVYSWGVLHHTGHMYEAIETAAKLVKPNGLYVLAIYNKHITSSSWLKVKWLYNSAPPLIRRLMYYFFYGVIYLAKWLVTRQNPLRKERGMDFGYDVVDWIGGYPYEYASTGEITEFLIKRGFKIERITPARVGTGCNEFVFRKMTN